jgi:hypothetical protein
MNSHPSSFLLTHSGKALLPFLQCDHDFLHHLRCVEVSRKIGSQFRHFEADLLLLIAFRLPKNIKGSVNIQ